jgi:putative ABC transport system permease protein
MAKTLAKKLGVKEGDFITIINTATNKKSTLKIGKLADIYLGNYAFLPIDKFNKLCNYPKGSYLEILSNKKLHIPDSKLISLTNIKDSSKAFIVLLKALNVTLITIGITKFVIGLIVMYVITSMLIEENKTNISLLKILGYPKKQVFSMILSSNKFLVIAGYLLAIPIIMKALAKLFESITQKLSFAIPIVVHISNLCICFVLIFITYEVSNVLSKNKINKIPMTDSLKNRGE